MGGREQISVMKLRVLLPIGVIGILLAYLFLFPVPVEPVAWRVPRAPSLDGKYAVNNDLQKMLTLYDDQCPACEDIAIDREGRLYGSSVEGDIIRFDGRNNSREVLVNTGGRPLGLDFDFLGNLLIADGDKGLLSMSPNGN